MAQVIDRIPSMGESTQVSIELSRHDDVGLLHMARRGNEAARALLLSRTLERLALLLSDYDRARSTGNARITSATYQEVSLRLRVIDTVIADLLGIGLVEVARPSDRSLDSLKELLSQDIEGSHPSGETNGSSEQLVDPGEKSWREFLGPFLTSEEAGKRLGIAAENDLNRLVTEGMLLALPMNDGGIAFPQFQFLRTGDVHPVIATVLRTFQGVVATPYTIAAWLKGPKDYLGGESPIRWLELERDPEPVIAGAQRAALQLSQ